jgi:hypothetical protein
MAPTTLTNDEILAKLAERMNGTPEGDSWRVKVFRRRIGGSYPFPIHLATLDGATLDQLANAEMWLPVLAGGGPVFELEAFHASDVARYAGGGRLRFTVQGDERQVSRDVVKQSNWHGPVNILYPLPSDPGVEPTPIFTSAPAAAAPPSAGGVTIVSGGAPQAATNASRFESGSSPEMRAALADLDAMRRDLAARQQREELAAIERKHRMELLELEAKFKTQQQAQVQAAATPQKPVAEIIAAVIGAATPLIAAVMESQRAAKAEQQKALDAIQQQNMLLMTKALEKPSIDPVMQQMMDRMTRALEDRPKPGEDMQPILEAFSRMTRMSTNSVAMAADLIARNSGQEEHPAMNIVREVRAAVEAVSEGIKASRIQPPARPPPQAPAPQQYAALPPAQPQPQPAPATNGAAGPQTPIPDRPTTLLEQIEARIRKYEDVESVGTQLLDAIAAAEPSVAQGMYAAGGSIIDLFQMRMGAWLNADPKNGPYIMTLAQYLTREAEKRGMLAGPEETAAADAAEEAAPTAQA